jgi:hypothetical protein
MMRKRIAISLLVIPFIILIMVSFTNHEEKQSQINSESEKTLAGDWICIDIKCEKICESCCEDLVYIDLRIRSDSVFLFEYPYMFHESKVISAIELPDPFLLRGDTLVMGINTYRRASFDPPVVAALLKDSINRQHLIGKWNLITRYSNGYNGDEQSDGFWYVEFPFKVPPALTFNSKNIIPPMMNGRKLMLPINGVNKEFYIRHVSTYRFTLVPGKWYEGDFDFEYCHSSLGKEILEYK